MSPPMHEDWERAREALQPVKQPSRINRRAPRAFVWIVIFLLIAPFTYGAAFHQVGWAVCASVMVLTALLIVWPKALPLGKSSGRRNAEKGLALLAVYTLHTSVRRHVGGHGHKHHHP